MDGDFDRPRRSTDDNVERLLHRTVEMHRSGSPSAAECHDCARSRSQSQQPCRSGEEHLVGRVGRFRLASLPLGDYIAFAIDGPDDGEWRNPEFVAAHEAQGTAVRVAAAPAASVTLTALPPQ